MYPESQIGSQNDELPVQPQPDSGAYRNLFIKRVEEKLSVSQELYIILVPERCFWPVPQIAGIGMPCKLPVGPDKVAQYRLSELFKECQFDLPAGHRHLIRRDTPGPRRNGFHPRMSLLPPPKKRLFRGMVSLSPIGWAKPPNSRNEKSVFGVIGTYLR